MYSENDNDDMVADFDVEAMAERMGASYLAARLRMEAAHAADAFGHGVTFFHIENMPWLHRLIRLCCKATGIYQIGYRHFRDLRIVHNTVRIPALPLDMDGFRILQLSDVHLDLDPGYTDVIVDRVASCDYDICVMTGDYRNRTYGPYRRVVESFRKIRDAIPTKVYAILGNHDFVEMINALEPLDVSFLINESVPIQRGSGRLWLVGIDDPIMYMLDNLEKALVEGPSSGPRILLSHAPGVYRMAEAHGIDLLLAGHTHGGQICLPGGIPLITNDTCKRDMVKGAWRYGDMQGYTSPGTGSCAVPVRFFCPPEMTIHTLTTAV